MKILMTTALGAAGAVCASAATAATLSFGGIATSSLVLPDGLTLDIYAYTYVEGSPIGTSPATVTYNTNGLGVDSGAGDPKLDASSNEMLVFAFSAPVIVTGVSFWNADQNDYVDLAFGALGALEIATGADDILTQSVNGFLTSEMISAAAFGVGMNTGSHSDQVRIASISYDLPAVPVPAAGVLLLGALGGLGALRLRRKSA